MKKILAFGLLVLSVVLTSCSAQTSVTTNEKINVYTSFYAMYDFTKMIGGDKINVENLVPTGVEPHDWEPSSADIVKLENADVFIYSGADMESWTDKVIGSISNNKLISVEAARDVKLVEETPKEENKAEDDYHGDPHVWLDPQNALIQMKAITDALCQADSVNTSYYKANLETCREKINALDEKYKQTIKSFKKKNIIVSHEAYGYLCREYGLEQVGIEGILADSEPSPSKMAEIVSFAKTNDIKYIFAENLGSSKVPEVIANEIGGEVMVLNPFEGDVGGKDYFTVMEENLTVLTKALK